MAENYIIRKRANNQFIDNIEVRFGTAEAALKIWAREQDKDWQEYYLVSMVPPHGINCSCNYCDYNDK